MEKKVNTAMRSSVELRKQAEAQLESQASLNRARVSDDSAKKVFHDLQVHKIELEMQNQELKEALTQRNAALESYTELYEFAPVPYLTIGRNSIILNANYAAASLLGKAAESLYALRLGAFFSDDALPAFNAFLDKAFISSKKESCETKLLVDGHTLSVMLHSNRGQKKGDLLIEIVDVSQLKLSQRLLIESEVKLESERLQLDTFIASTPDLVWLKDLDGVFLHCNSRFESLFGVKNKDIYGKTVYDFFDKEKADRFSFHDEAAMQSEKGLVHEEQLIFADGHTEQLETTKRAMLDRDGNIIGVIGISRNVTEQKQVQQQLILAHKEKEKRSDALVLVNKELAFKDKRESELIIANINKDKRVLELDAIFTLSPDGVVLVNANNKIGYINPVFSAITGLEEKSFVGKDAQIFIEAMKNLFDSDVMKMEAIKYFGDEDGEQQVYLKHPTLRVLKVNIRTIIGLAGKREGQVLYFRDTTHETAVDKMKSQFLTTAAHELRTPLTSVMGFSELLSIRDYSPEKTKEIAETINKHSMRLKKLLDDLLDLASIENRTIGILRMEQDTLEVVLTELCEDISGSDNFHTIDLKKPNYWPVIEFDQSKLRQIISNLLNNAYKYAPNSSNVNVSTTMRKAGEISEFGVVIEDSGIGMTPEQLSHLGERFYRADTSGNIAGTGLGISLVKELIKMHNGRFEVDSTLGIGTVVTVWLMTLE